MGCGNKYRHNRAGKYTADELYEVNKYDSLRLDFYFDAKIKTQIFHFDLVTCFRLYLYKSKVPLIMFLHK